MPEKKIYAVFAVIAVVCLGEAMSSTDYRDLTHTPEKVASTIATLASNAAHLATLLKAHPYPAP